MILNLVLSKFTILWLEKLSSHKNQCLLRNVLRNFQPVSFVNKIFPHKNYQK
jgi:hypothetical protein